jgi:hypothetical protein
VHLALGLEFQNLKFEKLGFPHKTLSCSCSFIISAVSIAVAVSVEVSAGVPVAVTLEVLRVGNYYRCYQMVPLPANTIRGIYSHMFKLLIFKGYLWEKGSLTIYPEGSQDPTHSEE